MTINIETESIEYIHNRTALPDVEISFHKGYFVKPMSYPSINENVANFRMEHGRVNQQQADSL